VKRSYRHVGTNEKPDGDKTTSQELGSRAPAPSGDQSMFIGDERVSDENGEQEAPR
jgi:hypothetical protein